MEKLIVMGGRGEDKTKGKHSPFTTDTYGGLELERLKLFLFLYSKTKATPTSFALHQFCASRRPHDGQILRRARSHLVVKTKNSSWQNRINMACLLNEQHL